MLLVDTNVLLAAADRSAPEHLACSELLDRDDNLIVSAPVAIECAWMIESRLGAVAEAAFVSSIARRELRCIDLVADDWARCAELIQEYADLRLGLVDASVVTIAERLGLSTLATLNRRDFAVVRPRHVEAFKLIP